MLTNAKVLEFDEEINPKELCIRLTEVEGKPSHAVVSVNIPLEVGMKAGSNARDSFKKVIVYNDPGIAKYDEVAIACSAEGLVIFTGSITKPRRWDATNRVKSWGQVSLRGVVKK